MKFRSENIQVRILVVYLVVVETRIELGFKLDNIPSAEMYIKIVILQYDHLKLSIFICLLGSLGYT